jgi:hypothetical protein
MDRRSKRIFPKTSPVQLKKIEQLSQTRINIEYARINLEISYFNQDTHFETFLYYTHIISQSKTKKVSLKLISVAEVIVILSFHLLFALK